jgi:DNA ligase-1
MQGANASLKDAEAKLAGAQARLVALQERHNVLSGELEVGLVVAKDPSTASQKAEKARAMGVPVIGIPALQRMLAGGAMPRAQAQAPRQAPRVQAPRASSGDPLKGGVLLAEKWTPEIDPTGYWMSEKLDGVRAIWDGEAFSSRNGNRFSTPASFARLLPKTPLDGELYIGPRQFHEAVSIVRSGVANPQRWKSIRYMVFDLPDSREPFEERVRHIRSIVAEACRKSDGPCPIEAVEQVRCTSPAHFGKFHAEAVARGNEGTMLRAPGSAYERRRSRTLLKAKDFFDAEARIVGTYAGEGKHRGRLGGYEAVDEETGVRFRVGTGLTDRQRENPLPVGTRITYRYQERNPSGAPRFPTFVAVRDYE